MTLYDEIIDTAERLASDAPTLDFSTHEEIVDKVSDEIGVKLGYNSIGARLAQAAYNRVREARVHAELEMPGIISQYHAA